LSYVPPSSPTDTEPPLAQEALSYESLGASNAVTLGGIAVKLLGVYCIVLALPFLSLLANLLNQGSRMTASWFVIGTSPYVIYTALGIALMRAGDWVAMRVFARGPILTPMRGPEGEYWQAMAFSIVGVLAVLHALPSLFSLGYYAIQFPTRSLLRGDVFVPAMQAVLGIILFLGGKGLARFWHRVRTAGTPQESAQQPS
jgi:hypothetical protein